MSGSIDLHQHLWPEELVDLLRARSRPPYLRGWRLVLDGEPSYDVQSTDHDPEARLRADRDASVGLACVSLSAPLGLESLPRTEAQQALDAWHEGARRLPSHFRAWASMPVVEPDAGELWTLLADGFIGLQLPATSVSSPDHWHALAPLLRVAEEADRPVLVHPGPVAPVTKSTPAWWAPVVEYVGQMQAAWWGWQAGTLRRSLPDLRVVFAAGAGLAPVHHERHSLRGGDRRPVDPGLFVDTSCYGPQALDALIRILGIDALVLGSDRPYGAPSATLPGDAARLAVHHTNPRRALGAAVHSKEVRSWPEAV